MQKQAEWLRSHKFTCAAASTEYFKKLLRLPESAPYALNKVDWAGEYFRIEFLHKATGKACAMALEQYSREREWLYARYDQVRLANDFMALFLEDSFKPALKKSLKVFLNSLGALPSQELFKEVYNDNRKYARGLSLSGLDICGPRSLQSTFFEWGDPHFRYTFMLTEDLLDPMWQFKLSGKNRVLLSCGDNECNYTYFHPFNFFDHFLAFNTYHRYMPYVENIFRDDRGQLEREIRSGGFFRKMISNYAFFDLKDRDIIMGSDKGLSGIMDKIASCDKGITVNVACPCVCKITGCDLRSLVEQANRKNGSRLIYDHNHGEKSVDEFKALLKDTLMSAPAARDKGRSVNLVGFGNDRSAQELAADLKRFFGIDCRAMLLPEIDVGVLKDYGRASLQALNPLRVYDRVYEQVFKKIKMKTYAAAAPYGFKRSVEWLSGLAAAAGVKLKKNDEWQQYLCQQDVAWRLLTAQAARYRLGLVISGQDADCLAEPARYPFGIPLISCLEEMGFGLDIVFIQDEKFQERKKLIAGLLNDKKRHKIGLLKDPGRLTAWIRDGDSDCIYSDLRDDQRVVASGKNVFSLFLFEKGLAGAVRTLEELLIRCGNRYFNDHKKYAGQEAHPISLQE